MPNTTKRSDPRNDRYSVMLTPAPHTDQPSAHTTGIVVAIPVSTYKARAIDSTMPHSAAGCKVCAWILLKGAYRKLACPTVGPRNLHDSRYLTRFSVPLIPNTHNRQAGQSGDVTDDMMNLEIHLVQRLVHVENMGGRQLDQIVTMAQ